MQQRSYEPVTPVLVQRRQGHSLSGRRQPLPVSTAAFHLREDAGLGAVGRRGRRGGRFLDGIHDTAADDLVTYGPAEGAAALDKVSLFLKSIATERPFWPGDSLLPPPGRKAPFEQVGLQPAGGKRGRSTRQAICTERRTSEGRRRAMVREVSREPAWSLDSSR